MVDIVVIGAGAAGMMAAYAAARSGAKVVLAERNHHPGRKILLTGKGRCNVTNGTDPQGIVAAFPETGRFLLGPVSRFTPDDLMRFIQEQGVPLKVERGRRVFPESDRSSDIVRALRNAAAGAGVQFRPDSRVERVDECKAQHDGGDNRHIFQIAFSGGVGGVGGVQDGLGSQAGPHSQDALQCKAVIIATGGLSYPATGSTGDGYRFARQYGHTIANPFPSLVPLETTEKWVPQLQGLSLKNVTMRALSGEQIIGEEFGEMLFTHYGVSGPIVLSLSRAVVRAMQPGTGAAAFTAGKAQKVPAMRIVLELDLKPALDIEKLDARVVRDWTSISRKHFSNALDALLPKKMIPVIIALCGIDGDTPVNQITREQRLGLVSLLKKLVMTVTGYRPIAEAIVTSGGVNIKEINARTMESKLAPGLFFAGEVIDVDGYTGGYNLQAAFSTGYAAGVGAAEYCHKN